MATTGINPTNSALLDTNMFGWNRQGQYYTLETTLGPGYGCWMYAYEECEIWIQYTVHPSDNYITKVEPSWNIVSIPFNQSVIKLHTRFGFLEEGVFRRHVLKNAMYEDVVALAIFKEEWTLIREKMKNICFRNKVVR